MDQTQATYPKGSALYRGWHALERKLGGMDIVDFDLIASTECATFTSRNQVLLALESAHRSIAGTDLASQFNRDRLNASIYYLQACLGEQVPFEEYVLNTMGAAPKRFSELQLVESFAQVNELLGEIGLRFSSEYKEAYQKQCLISDKSSVKEKINQQLGKWLNHLSKHITVPELDHVSVSFADVDAYWSNWVNGSVRDGFELRVNLHPRVKYLKGAPSLLAAHEYCGHLVQVQQWALNMAHGTIEPSYGFSTVHSPEAFMMEGLADVLVYILVDDAELDFDEQLARQLSWHSRLLSNNIHYLINTGHSFRDVFAYYRKYAPFAEDVTIESSIRDRSNDPLGRTYQYVYGIALDYFRQVFEGQPDRVAEFLPKLYQRPYTKTQLDQLFGLNDR
ncbi:hypothetical protein IQ266_25630 [filamentous cyanobacterium LEGE 11480]|uniref:Uncharacterized protein n=1 Tax=Romeriopsis navalis LEGE 11480 TaxID=2777977 RepID=A0A928Z6Y2_9CYAN|nr:hypothetical protein [Romeriopsis navalis]MBE9033123.1 hypothetical protein [Romeriopsis navalis LEGE 11480]